MKWTLPGCKRFTSEGLPQAPRRAGGWARVSRSGLCSLLRLTAGAIRTSDLAELDQQRSGPKRLRVVLRASHEGARHCSLRYLVRFAVDLALSEASASHRVGSTLHAAAHKRTEVIIPEALAKALPAAGPLVRGDVGKFLGKAGLHRSVEVATL
jgi:hypothetical protein